MRILFVSNDLMAGNIALTLKNEGCDVRLYIGRKQEKRNFHNLVPKTTQWKKELRWVGKDGLIVFDDIGFGSQQDALRRKGYSVFGGSALGDKLEEDRQWAQEIFKRYGMKTLPTRNFKGIESAIAFTRRHEGPWVIKQNKDASKWTNYVGRFKDNRDVISMLENYKKNYGAKLHVITLQKRVYGVEIGIGRYFNGNDWVGPIEMNVEHKKLFPGDLGPSTGEMGTLAWYDDNEKNKLFQETLAKLKPFLRKIDFRGDMDIGCIVNKEGVYPLEATPRLGSPIIHLHNELHVSPWHAFLKAIADKKPFALKWKKGFGIVALVSVPPSPYAEKTEVKGNSSFGVGIYFDPSIKRSDFAHVHFEGVSMEPGKNGSKQYYISDHRGDVLYVTAVGKTIEKARQKVGNVLEKIYIPKMFYRNDIGVNFEKEDRSKLKNWRYLG